MALLGEVVPGLGPVETHPVISFSVFLQGRYICHVLELNERCCNPVEGVALGPLVHMEVVFL